MPFSTTPASSSGTRTARECVSGSRASVPSMAMPTTKTLDTVPSPGRWRNGIHSSSTAAPTMIDTTPIVRPVSSASPWCSTFHGSRPSPASTSRAELPPYRARPA